MNMKEARRRHRAEKRAGRTVDPFRKWARWELRRRKDLVGKLRNVVGL